MSSSTFLARHKGRVWAAIVVTLLMTGGVAFSGALSAQADSVVLQPGQLVVNGDAEQPVSVGWTGVLARKTHGAAGYPAAVTVGPGGLTGATFAGGSALFVGIGAASVATQTVDLTPSAAAIDNGHISAIASAYVGGYSNQADNASVSYDFHNAVGASLAKVTFGPALRADRGDASGFVPFSATQLLPVGTRQVLITITTKRFIAPANDGYADNISLVLDAPSPVARPDTASTNQGTAVVVNPVTNDTPGAGATLVPSSIRLLDGASEVTSLTTASGNYQVNTVSGAVTFTPTSSYFGTTPSVSYRITDSSGQRAQSTIVITVIFVAAPALTLVKSASPSAPADFTLGTVVTYSFVVTNTGNVPIDNVAIVEVSFTGASPMVAPVCPVSTLAAGEQEVCTATYTLVQADIDQLGVQNVARATGTGLGVNVASPDSAFGVPIAGAPAISLSKTVNAAGASHSGDSVDYSFLVTNTGNVSVTAVAVAEISFSGTGGIPAASCPVATLLPGQLVICTANYTLTQSDVDAGTVTNTATAEATSSSGTAISAPSSATVIIAAQPSFTFAKTADLSAITTNGQVVTYSFTIANTGNVTLSNPVISDTEFSGAGTLGAITCPSTLVAPASSLVCAAKYTTLAPDLDEVTLSNRASVQVSDPAAGTHISALSTVVIPINPATDATVTPPVTKELAFTGVDPVAPIMAGGSLTLAGIGLLAIAGLRRLFAQSSRSKRRPSGL